MPRIPVRTEPYDSPSRQHRHYKNKRDQVLRTLGKASFINSSQFLLMLVTATGTVESFASEAFQAAKPKWLEESGVEKEAKQLVLARAARRAAGNNTSNNDASSSRSGIETAEAEDEGPDEEDDDNSRVDSDDDFDADAPVDVSNNTSFIMNISQASEATSSNLTPQPQQQQQSTSSTTPSQSKSATPVIDGEDVFGGGPIRPDSAAGSHLTDNVGKGLGLAKMRGKKLSPLDIDSANKPFAASGGLLQPFSAQDPKFLRAPNSAPLPNRGKHLVRPPHSKPSNGISPLIGDAKPLTLMNRQARTDFLMLRFGQLQQGMCKTVAKAWIKIIEPKKQTRCPYNKGEAGKPDWWPEGVRHKEPDHLMKPERHILLLTILRSPKIEVTRLRLATAEMVAMIRADRVDLLMDCYTVAQQEEQLRAEGKGDAEDSPIHIQVSTLDGWRTGEHGGLDEEGKRLTSGDDTPEVDEKRKTSKAPRKTRAEDPAETDGLALNRRKKRKADTPVEDVSSLGVGPSGSSFNLQRSISTPGPLAHMQQGGSDGTQQQRSLAEANQAWLGNDAMSHAQAEALAREEASRRQIASDAVNSAVHAGLVYGQGNRPAFPYDQQFSQFNHPLSAGSGAQFFDYNFMPEHRLEQIGTMSAPQGQHAQLYPEHALYPHQPQHQAHQHHAQQQLSTQSSPMVNQDHFSYPGNFVFNGFVADNLSQSQPHRGSEVEYGHAQLNGGQPGGLGLQGVPDPNSQDLSWAASFDGSGPGFVVNTGWAGTSGTDGSAAMGNPFAVPGSAPARVAPLPDLSSEDSMGDSTMDRSFNTTVSSTGGPATPPSNESQQSMDKAMNSQQRQGLLSSQDGSEYATLSGYRKTRGGLATAFDSSIWPSSDAAH